MSTFSVVMKRIRAIEAHPNADAIEFAVVDGYRSIVKKGQFKAGDVVAYIPEASVLPEYLLKQLGFWDEEKCCGKLHGKEGNRVKAIKLRGELSQGICMEMSTHAEGDDVTEYLGITKYEPPIPVGMSGEVFSVPQSMTVNFDVENWKSYPDIINDGDPVVFTEKIHGTFTGIAVLPRENAHLDAFGLHKNILIFSKGLGAKGLVFKNNEKNENNLYVRSTREIVKWLEHRDVYEPIFILGETYGPGVQDLTYGDKISFRVFAMAARSGPSLTYYDWDVVRMKCKTMGCETVPVLYEGPFSVDVMMEYTNGKTTLGANHIREGIVIVPKREICNHPEIGRVCLKSVSADYLTRKGGTEFN